MSDERYYLVDKHGTYQVYYRYVDLLRHLYYHGMYDVGNCFNDTFREYDNPNDFWSTSWYTEVRYIVLDQHFRGVHTEQLKKDLIWFEANIQELNRDYNRRHRRKYSYIDGTFEFRRGPVPGTGGSNKRYCRYFRHPKTTQEIREYYYEDKQFVRAKRSPRYLPSVYDDVYRGDQVWGNSQSWKRSKKKKQWM